MRLGPAKVGDWALFLALTALAAWAASLLDACRLNLALSADLNTIGILNEDYLWTLVLGPERVDEPARQMFRVAELMYPTVPLGFLPHLLVQSLIPAAGSSQFFHSMSLYCTMFLLSTLFFVGRGKGLGPGTSLLATICVLASPVLLTLAVSAPLIPTSALLPLAYLLHLKKKRGWALFLLLAVSLTYRLGSFYLLLLFLALGGRDEDPELASQRRLFMKVLAGLVVVQVATQMLLVLFNPYLKGMEGPRIGYAFSILARFIRNPLDPEALGRTAEVLGWLLAGGFALLLRGASLRRLVLPFAIAGHIWFISGAQSQSLVIFAGIVGIVLVETVAERSRAATPRPLAPLPAVLAGAAVVLFAVPMVSQAERGDTTEAASRLTPWSYLVETDSRPPDRHLAAVREVLDGLHGGKLCLVDPYLVPFIHGQTCRRIIPIGKEESIADREWDYVIVDLSEGATRFHQRMAQYLRTAPRWTSLFNEAVEWGSASGHLGIRRTTDRCYVLTRGPGPRIPPEAVQAGRLEPPAEWSEELRLFRHPSE